MDNGHNIDNIGIEFYHPDPGWKDFKLSTKRSFLLIADQALQVSANGIEIAITSEHKSHIALVIGERVLPIVQISPGIFDRYWDFLTSALRSENGLRLKRKGKDEIYDISGEGMNVERGRKIVMHFSEPMSERDFINLDS